MKRFILVEQQSGGCDYTIGCGFRETEFEAESLDAALALVKRNAMADGDDDGPGNEVTDEERVDLATIYEVASSVEVPVAEWRAELKRWCDEDAERVKREKERAEYERLRAKFESDGSPVSTRVEKPVVRTEERPDDGCREIATSVVHVGFGQLVTRGE